MTDASVNYAQALAKIDDVQGQVLSIFGKLNDRMERFEGRLDAVEGRLGGIETRVEQLAVGQRLLNERLDNVDARLSGLESGQRAILDHLGVFTRNSDLTPDLVAARIRMSLRDKAIVEQEAIQQLAPFKDAGWDVFDATTMVKQIEPLAGQGLIDLRAKYRATLRDPVWMQFDQTGVVNSFGTAEEALDFVNVVVAEMERQSNW